MKKIKHLIVLYPSFELGGATANLINFVNECEKEKIKVHLISNVTQSYKKKFFSKNIEFINPNTDVNNLSKKSRLSTSLKSCISLVKLFKRIDSSKSIVVSFQSHILPIILSKFFNQKIIIRNSEDILDATKYADLKIFAYFIFLLKAFFYNFSNGIITNSIKAKRSLNLITFKNKTKLIYNPYLKKIFNNNNKERKNFILSVGRLCKQKNQTLIIKAFEIFLKKFPSYKLILIGHGNDEINLKILCKRLKISKNVIFKSWISNPKEYYLKSKIFIFPSLYEGLPNALIEAVNYNLPCISSKCSGAEDILTKKYGIFIGKNDHRLLADKMIDSIKNYKKTLSNTKKIKKKLSRFLVKPQVLKYISYCNNILSGFNK
jgi:GalNAc-alpha-(1->4)-GalNAc-alpha-(1->3)-diNAcBac-PP-undecaprenol alpha-1,4-N-acetyl-D-galactosaminyltransferase